MAEPPVITRPTWRGWTRGEGLIVVAGVLLAADLVLMPWHHYALHVDVSNLGVSLPQFAYDRSGVQNPGALLGVASMTIAVLMTLQVVAAKARPAVARLAVAHLVAGPAALGLLIAKLLSDDTFLGTGAWLGLLLGAALGLGGYMRSQESSALPETTLSGGPPSGPLTPT